MKFLFILLLPLVNAFSKEFEAPVARRDADMCAVYLCPSLPDHATSYLQTGCQGSFSQWIQDTISKTPETLLITETTSNSHCVHWSTLLFLVSFSITFSFYIGWKEHQLQHKLHSH